MRLEPANNKFGETKLTVTISKPSAPSCILYDCIIPANSNPSYIILPSIFLTSPILKMAGDPKGA